MTNGICYLVGAGPGDPELLTLKGRRCLAQAEVVVYDYLCNPTLLRWAPPEAEVIYAGKQAGAHTLKQEEINRLLVEHTGQGRRVVRLKGGDPYLFGRGGEEAMALAEAGLAFEVVPGISSALAGPAYAGIPVTHRKLTSSLTIFTGHDDPAKEESLVRFKSLASSGATLVMLMGVEKLEEVTRRLIDEGADRGLPAALIRWATTGRQEVLTATLESIAGQAREKGWRPPSLAVFGEVVRLRDELDWFGKKPLHRQRIVVTRTRAQAGALSERLTELGADAVELPVIRIESRAREAAFEEMVRDAHAYDWIIFTSPNGAGIFFETFYRLYRDAREIGAARFAVMGPGTGRVVGANHFQVDLMPEKYVAEELLEAFAKQGSVENQRLLLVRAEEVRDVLAKGLMERGAILDEAVAYRTVPEAGAPAAVLQRLAEDGTDWVTFTSASTVKNFFEANVELPEGWKAASIGPITSEELRRHGIEPSVEADPHDIPGLVEALSRARE